MSNPYYQNQGQNSYEMNSYNANNPYDPAPQGNYGYQAPAQQTYGGQSYGDSDDVGFYNEIKGINTLLDNYTVLINNIASNQRRLLSEVDEEQEYRLSKDIDSLTAQASNQQTEIKQRLQTVTNKSVNDSSKKAQVDSVKEHFLQEIQRFRSAEADYKQRAKEQAITQYQIVQPNASRQEASAAIDDVGGQQIFSQALLNSSMKGQAQSALNEVKARHKEIQKIEQSMRELNQLFRDVEALVAEQDTQVETVAQRVEEARVDIQHGLKHEEEALEKAKAARRKKCWCIWICIIIAIIVIAAIVGGIAGKFANK
ncbi:syntaxin [Saccharomycopsis crataegensis]|uniref:Syntaxin n=1 Tax=Saccharomycopsis crataegensis TaxID=43959 RepID=A0AAV5QRB2_9ASCO|nr:syntaxin [Saccharomycopsis crataegensis]